MRVIISIFLGLMCHFLQGQTVLETLSEPPKKSDKQKDFYALVNSNNFETFFFNKKKTELSVHLFSSGFLLKDSLVISDFNPKLTNIIGGRVDNETQPRLYFTDEDFSSIYTYAFNLKTKKQDSIARFEIPKNEYVTQIFEHKNGLYLFTISKDESWVRVYGFKNNAQPLVQTYSLEGFIVTTATEKELKFKDLIRRSNSLEFPFTIEHIKPDFQPQLIQVAARRKMYVQDEKIYLSFDYNPEKTSWIVLDLKEHSVRFHETNLPKIVSNGDVDSKYNTFLHERFIYTLKKTNDTLKIEIIDFETNEVAKRFVGTPEKIDFSNTELFYNPGNNKPFKLYKGPKPFFKKTRNSSWGISVFTEHDGISMTVGAVKENPSAALLAADIFLNAVVIAAGSEVDYEPILMNFSEIEFQSSFFESKLDLNLRHQFGELEPNAEHKINFFLSENPKVKNVFVFKRLSFYVLSYYDDKDEKIYFRKFD